MDRDNISIQTVIGVIFVIAALAIVPAVISVLTESVDNQVTTKSLVEEASYIIYLDGEYACVKNGTSGRIDLRTSDHAAAFNYAVSDTSRTVFVRSGYYQIGTSIDLSAFRFGILIGEGVGTDISNKGVVLHLNDGANIPIMKAIGTSTHLHIKISNFIFNANNATQTVANDALVFSSVKKITVENCVFTYASRYGVNIINCEEIAIVGCTATKNTLDGFYTNGAGAFDGCAAYSNKGNGFHVGGLYGQSFNGCSAYLNSLNGFFLENSKEARLIGCAATYNTQQGFILVANQYSSLISCVAKNNNQAGTGTRYGFGFDSCTNCSLIGSLAYDNQATKTQNYGACEWGTSDYNTFSDNKFISNKVGGVYLHTGTHTLWDNNQGYVTEASGTATIASGGKSITVNHGMNGAPTKVIVTGSNNYTAACWVTAIGTTTFVINVASAVGTNSVVYWYAEV